MATTYQKIIPEQADLISDAPSPSEAAVTKTKTATE